MGKLRKLKETVKPTFQTDESGADEHTDGDVHSGSILVRNYIDNLDMDFYAGRASSKKGEETEPISMRLPSDLIKDIAILVESRRTRFRDRSELIRTATYILVNYLAHRFKKGIKDISILRDIEDYNLHEQKRKQKVHDICERFTNFFREKEKDGDVELGKWIKKNVEMAKLEKSFYRNKMLNSFWNTIQGNGIDPSQYIDQGELEGE